MEQAQWKMPAVEVGNDVTFYRDDTRTGYPGIVVSKGEDTVDILAFVPGGMRFIQTAYHVDSPRLKQNAILRAQMWDFAEKHNHIAELMRRVAELETALTRHLAAEMDTGEERITVEEKIRQMLLADMDQVVIRKTLNVHHSTVARIAKEMQEATA